MSMAFPWIVFGAIYESTIHLFILLLRPPPDSHPPSYSVASGWLVRSVSSPSDEEKWEISMTFEVPITLSRVGKRISGVVLQPLCICTSFCLDSIKKRSFETSLVFVFICIVFQKPVWHFEHDATAGQGGNSPWQHHRHQQVSHARASCRLYVHSSVSH